MIHWLKTEPQFFQMLWDGSKPFEVRFNDRLFSEGDLLMIADGTANASATRLVIARVASVFQFREMVKDGYVVLGLTVLGRMDSNDHDGIELFKYRTETITCEQWTSRERIVVGNEAK